MPLRRLAASLALACAALVLVAPEAVAKEFSLPNARVEARLLPDGSVRVTEELTYNFIGSFEGAYREIPLRSGESVDSIAVSEAGRAYSPGASAELGSSGPPDSYGVADLGDRVRIVWHYGATDESRTFEVSYVLRGLAVVYDDIVDVNLRVWGDEWDVSLERLSARTTSPRGAPEGVRVWGHPASVEGFTELLTNGHGARLTATFVPPHTWVEMRVLFGRSVLDSTTGARVADGNGLEAIVAEEQAAAEAVARDRRRLDWLKANLGWLLPLGLALAFLPGLLLVLYLWRRYGKEPDVPFTTPYLPEAPGTEPPALVAALLEPGSSKVAATAFTATMFDLIRRRYVEAIATQTERRTWAGLKRDLTDDLSIRIGKNATDELLPFEKTVLDALNFAVAANERLLLSEMRGVIKENAEKYRTYFDDFKTQVMDEVKAHGWWQTGGLQVAVIAAALAGLVTVGAIALAGGSNDPTQVVAWGTIVWGTVAAIAGINGGILIAFIAVRRGWERRSDEGARSASQWDAFRRYLTDFAGMAEAPPGSIEIWEQYLCYAVAFGVADRVLAAAQIHAPPELNETSPIYWIGSDGSLGSGPSAFAISDITGALTPASGGGGGFSGGGGEAAAVAEVERGNAWTGRRGPL